MAFYTVLLCTYAKLGMPHLCTIHKVETYYVDRDTFIPNNCRNKWLWKLKNITN